MPHRRLYKGIALGVVGVLALGSLLVAPAMAGRAVKASYHAMPDPVRGLVPDSAEQAVGRGVDGVTRFFAFGNPDRLIGLDLRLESASVEPGGWIGDHRLVLSWTELGGGIDYVLTAGHSRSASNALDVPVGRVSEPQAVIDLPGDGDWYVRVRAFAGDNGGRTTTFGPFRVDSTPPPAPKLDSILPPPGYSFTLSWTGVSDTSGIRGYQVERLGSGSLFQPVAQMRDLSYREDQLGNGEYSYRVRAINGAGVLSLPSNEQDVTVKAPMKNPGAGLFRYGIHANYTSFLKLWDISDASKYARVDQVPLHIRQAYMGDGWGFEIDNATLAERTQDIVGSEKNTMRIAEKLFVWLFDYADYDTFKLQKSASGGDAGGLQSAGQTYDRRKGICGDLATLYITMLRIAGVPARPVHGYLDNPGAGVGDFHVWVEVWVGTSLRSGDPSDTRDDWMAVDVSGAGDGASSDSKVRAEAGFDLEDLMVYFGVFNPEYLALGLDADYADSSWNAWAQFGWSNRGTVDPPRFAALGKPFEVSYETMRLYFDPLSKKRALVPDGRDPPSSEYNMYFENVKVVSKKRIDYGVNLTGPTPINATIRVRYPVADAFAAVLPWQSVIYTIYSNSPTASGYTRDAFGFVVWEDDFKP